MLANLNSIQMFLAIRKSNDQGYLIGFGVAVLESISLYLFIIYFAMPWLILTDRSVVAAIVLLIKDRKWTSRVVTR